MASLLTDLEKTEIQSALDDVHDTFKRAITVFLKKKTTVTTDNTNYNPLYDRTHGQQKSIETLEPHTVMARINYFAPSDINAINAGGQLSLQPNQNKLEMKVSVADSELIKKAAKIEIDDMIYSDISPQSVMGIFSAKYHVYYLTRE